MIGRDYQPVKYPTATENMFIGKVNLVRKKTMLNDYEYWPNFKIDLEHEIGNLNNGFYSVYILNSIRNAKVFFIKTLSDGPLRFKYYERSLIMWGE